MPTPIERTVYFKKEEVEKEKEFYEYITKRNTSKTTSKKLVYVFMNYCNLNNMRLEELINEADHEEEKGIRLKKRKINYRLENFRITLLNNGFATNTIREDFNKIKTLYRTFGIEIPYLIPFKLPSKQLIYDDVPNKRHIKQAVESANSKLHKAIILFQFSSCTAIAETNTITCGMFVKATEEYHNEVDINKVIHILQKREEEDMIPLFLLARQKKSNAIEEGYKYYTCCTPEATEYILDYLEDRIQKNGYLKNKDKLFDISKGTMGVMYSRINDKNDFGRVGGDRRFFHSHGMRIAGNTAIGNRDDGDAFSGRKRSTIHEGYFKNNPKELKNIYKKYIPKLSIGNMEANYLDIETKQIVNNQVKEAEIKIIGVEKIYSYAHAELTAFK